MSQTMVPPLNAQAVNIVIHETLPYAWQQFIVSVLKVKIDTHRDVDFATICLHSPVLETSAQGAEESETRQGLGSSGGAHSPTAGEWRLAQTGHLPPLRPTHLARDCPTAHFGMQPANPGGYMLYPQY